MATLRDFFSLPIGGAGAGANPYLRSESGRPIYETPLGVTFEIVPEASEAAKRKKRVADAMMPKNPLYADYNARRRKEVENPTPAGLNRAGSALLGAILQGVEAPGRAARGEPVTYGDAWATALDYGAIAAPAGKPAGALGGGGIRGKADDAARMLSEKYGIKPSVSYHPTSWGESAYVRARIPGPDGTYFDGGFRLSDHEIGDFRKATDDVRTVIDSGDVTAESLFRSIVDDFSAAGPKMDEIAARRAERARLSDAAFLKWQGADEATKRAASDAYKANQGRKGGKAWRNLSALEKAESAMENGVFGGSGTLRDYLNQ